MYEKKINFEKLLKKAFLKGDQISLKVWNIIFLKNISTKGLIRC